MENKKLKIEYVKLSKIKPCENNPRIIPEEAVQKVADSIRSFGFKAPIIVDKDMIIIAGHTRFKAATELELEEVPIIVVDDLTDEQVKALRIADNKTAEYSAWDNDILRDLFNELDQAGYELELTGFNFDEVDEILNAEEEALDDLDLIKDDSDVKNSSMKKLVFGKYKCALTDEEFSKLEKLYLKYVEEQTTGYGFINNLLKDVKIWSL